MSKIKIEVYLSPGSCSDKLSGLLKEIEQEFGEKVKIIRLNEDSEIIDKYNINATPALIIEEMIKIVGFSPSKESLIAALQDAGME